MENFQKTLSIDEKLDLVLKAQEIMIDALGSIGLIKGRGPARTPKQITSVVDDKVEAFQRRRQQKNTQGGKL